MALRVARGYCTVSYEAACIVAGSFSWELTADLYTEMYNMKTARRIRALQEDQADPLENQRREEVRREALLRQRKFEEWKEALANTRKGFRAIGAIHPVLKEWVDRRHGALGFRLVQMLTGHGCFGEYLHRIRKEPTTACHHCDAPLDTAEHILAVCPAWEENRRVLRDVTAGGNYFPAHHSSGYGGWGRRVEGGGLFL
jgi:hypothetical protein